MGIENWNSSRTQNQILQSMLLTSSVSLLGSSSLIHLSVRLRTSVQHRNPILLSVQLPFLLLSPPWPAARNSPSCPLQSSLSHFASLSPSQKLFSPSCPHAFTKGQGNCWSWRRRRCQSLLHRVKNTLVK